MWEGRGEGERGRRRHGGRRDLMDEGTIVFEGVVRRWAVEGGWVGLSLGWELEVKTRSSRE